MKCKKCRHFYRMMAAGKGYNPFPYCHVQEDTGKRPEPLTQKCFEPREKRQRKKTCAVLLALVMLLLAGCGDKLREGEVCGKEFREAYTTRGRKTRRGPIRERRRETGTRRRTGLTAPSILICSRTRSGSLWSKRRWKSGPRWNMKCKS